MASDDLVFTLAWADVDPSVLPEDAREPGTQVFRRAVTEFLQRQYQSLGGRARIVFDDAARTVTVSWAKHKGFESVEQKALEALTRHDYGTAVPLLKALIAKRPNDVTHLYNLGMALSDQGRIREAIEELGHAVEIEPGHVNATIALGVAHARVGDLDEAVVLLREALSLEPGNPYAHQNLGACLLTRGDCTAAEEHFRRSLEVDAANMQSRLGLAQAIEKAGRLDEADSLYHEIISDAGHETAGRLAKDGRTRIAHANLRAKGEERPDVVMYCLGALERFETMRPDEVQAVGQEIAILGMRGLDINDPTQKYALKTLPGSFSGLHLLSLMYVAYRRLKPEADVGVDFSREYAQAEAMFRAR